MTSSEIDFIVKTIDTSNSEFYYFRDKYALDILKYYVKEEKKISELKSSCFAHLLNKNHVKDVVKTCGTGSLKREQLETYQIDEGRNFYYTLSKWGEYVQHRNDSWNQTSRPGYSLVLQLNFDQSHDYAYHKYIKKGINDDDNPFEMICHPILKKRGFTMAWCRMDVNLDLGEVLIEEVQNDWLREVRSLCKALAIRKRIKKEKRRGHWFFSYYSDEDFEAYSNLLDYYLKIWEEAILMLAIKFSLTELGISTIYMHEFESGNYLKGLKYSLPPRSLYTQLPRKFGFAQTSEAPEFLKKEKYLKKKLRKKDLKWWTLCF